MMKVGLCPFKSVMVVDVDEETLRLITDPANNVHTTEGRFITQRDNL